MKNQLVRLTIFSLILFPIKLFGVVSVFYLGMIPIFILGFFYTLIRVSSKNSVNLILLLLFLNLFYRIVYGVLTEVDVFVVALKGMTTIFLLAGLISLYSTRTIDWNYSVLRSIMIIMIIMISVVFSFSYLVGFNGIDYYNLTIPLFAFITQAGQEQDVTSKDVMRNTVGEIFVFFGFMIIIFNSKIKNSPFSYFVTNFMVFITFSRKALLQALAGALIVFIQRGRILILFLFTLFALLSLILIILLDTEVATASDSNLRQFNFSDESRLDMYAFVVGQKFEVLMIGNGLDATYKDKNIHNLLLNELYKTGAVGFILLVSLYLKLLFDFVVALFKKNKTCIFLLIPMLSMQVSSIYEFYVTPASLLSLGMFYGLKNIQKNK